VNSAQPITACVTNARCSRRWHWWLLAVGLPLLLSVWPWLARSWQAAGVTLLYVAFTVLVWHTHRRQRPVASAVSNATLVAYASQSGGAQRLAELTARQLQQRGEPVVLLALAQLSPARLGDYQRVLFIVSTYGEGEAPDNGIRFDQALRRGEVRCAELDFAVLALGDRHYRNYCAFGHRLASKLDQFGANPLCDTLELDSQDNLATSRVWQRWQQLVLGATSHEDASWTLPGFTPWRLHERRHLNRGSPGGAVFLVTLEPIEALPAWQAGDIAEILPVPFAVTPTDAPAHRDYSIASLPDQGTLQLLVRQHRGPDGKLGVGSGWLTELAAVGELIGVRLRTNPVFHPPAHHRPLILIGNGTGWAGLRAHLLARPQGSRNWLLFGERSPTHDGWINEELTTLFPPGLIERVDLAWSRDTVEPCYVQQRLRAAAPQLKQWIADGAAIYVCGSAAGMAQEVNTTLREVLGDQLDRLTDTSRYRRDVY
jgi:sulfite reductase (NADPH) flavoprotein alpha-component